MDDITEQKQACIDLMNAAGALFDLLDEHGEEGPFTAPEGEKVILDVATSYERATGPTRRLATRRMVAVAMKTDPSLIGRMIDGMERTDG